MLRSVRTCSEEKYVEALFLRKCPPGAKIFCVNGTGALFDAWMEKRMLRTWTKITPSLRIYTQEGFFIFKTKPCLSRQNLAIRTLTFQWKKF